MRSDTFKEIAEALAAAQGEMQNATANASNPDFQDSQYATLGAIRNATVPHLSRNKIALTQTIQRDDDNMLVLNTSLIHKSGEWIASDFPLPEDLLPNDPHAFGSALSYARRYSIGAITGIATDIDDDASAAVAGLKAVPARPARVIEQSPEDDRPEPAPAPVVTPPPPPLGPTGDSQLRIDGICPFEFVKTVETLDSLVSTFESWGFINRDTIPNRPLLSLLELDPGEFKTLIESYVSRIKEFSSAKTSTKTKTKAAAE